SNLRDQGRRHLVPALDLLLMRNEFLLHEGAHRIGQHSLLVAQGEIHGSVSRSKAPSSRAGGRTPSIGSQGRLKPPDQASRRMPTTIVRMVTGAPIRK